MEILDVLCGLLLRLPRPARHFVPLWKQLLGEVRYTMPRRTHPPRHLRGPEDEYKF